MFAYKMQQNDEIDPEQEIYQYQVLEYIEQSKDSYQFEQYYEGDWMDMMLNPYHLFDFLILIVDNEQHI